MDGENSRFQEQLGHMVYEERRGYPRAYAPVRLEGSSDGDGLRQFFAPGFKQDPGEGAVLKRTIIADY